MFSLRSIEQTIRLHPENLIFADIELLHKIVGNPDEYSSETRIPAITEIARRYLLNHKHDSVLHETIGNEAYTILKKLVEARILGSRCVISDSLWQNQKTLSQQTERFIREKVCEVFSNTDGYIPVYYRSQKKQTQKAFFIPFHLESSELSSQVCDLNGSCHEEWTQHFQQVQATAASVNFRCVLHLTFSNDIETLDGNSCMLPFLLAILRKQKKLAQYLPERLIATGALSNGALAPVDVSAKYTAFQNWFADAIFCCPKSDPPIKEFYDNQILPLGIKLEEIAARITKCIEANGLFIPSLKYVLTRLPKIEEDVRSKNYNNWDILSNIIENLEKGLDSDRSPEQYLVMQMLKNAVACHYGNTGEAIRINRNAYSFAQENGFTKEALRLDIDLLVEFMDQEDFSSIQCLTETLEQQLKDMNDIDLLMRYYGTMGQIASYGTLSNNSGFSDQKALTCFENALKCAFKTDNEEHIAQDRNYVHLWYALFQPGTQKEYNKFHDALQHIQCNLADQADNQFRNLCYLERQRAFAVYRHLLMYDKLPDYTTAEITLTDKPDDWLAALYGKYKGAVSAAQNNPVNAKKLFDDALQTIDLTRTVAIKAFIRMTVCAEAYRSLKDASYLTEGLQSFERYPQIRDYTTAARWEAYLRSPGENSFPGLEYWY